MTIFIGCRVPSSLKNTFELYLQYVISFCLNPSEFDDIMKTSEKALDRFKGPIRRIHDDINSKKFSLVSSNAWDATFKVSFRSFFFKIFSFKLKLFSFYLYKYLIIFNLSFIVAFVLCLSIISPHTIYFSFLLLLLTLFLERSRITPFI